MSATITHPSPMSDSEAYVYFKPEDEMPTQEQIAQEADPLCRVKLFLPAGRWTWYVSALTNYGTDDDPQWVITSHTLSGIDPDYDEYGDSGLDELMGIKVMGLTIERDLGFQPMRLSEIKAKIEGGGHV